MAVARLARFYCGPMAALTPGARRDDGGTEAAIMTAMVVTTVAVGAEVLDKTATQMTVMVVTTVTVGAEAADAAARGRSLAYPGGRAANHRQFSIDGAGKSGCSPQWIAF
jgi:hypothetical protein